MALRKACAYYRMSRGRKHRSKFNVHQQRAVCMALARDHGFRIVEEFIEIEFNRGMETLKQRPVLAACIDFAKQESCVIFAAHIERISRNVNLLTDLLQKDVQFVFGNPLAGQTAMVLGTFPKGRGSRSKRTGERIAAALKKRRDAGLPVGNDQNLEEAARRGREVLQRQATSFALQIFPVIEEIRSDNALSLQSVADELNRRSILTARGRTWTATAVRRVLQKADQKFGQQ